MKEIRLIVEHIKDEVSDAETYAKLALQYRATDKELSSAFVTLSTQEINHSEILHDQAVRLIRARGEPAPVSMQAVWDWEHDNYIERVAKVKALLEMVKK